MRRTGMFLAAFMLAIMSFLGALFAGTTGKIVGEVIDDDGDAVAAADVMLINPGTKDTINYSTTDLDGNYLFLDVRPGFYDIIVSSVGYATMTVQRISVSADRTSTANVKLKSEAMKGEEMVVSAQKTDLVKRDVTGSSSTTSAEDIQKGAFNSVSEVIATKSGVKRQGSELHFRGGRGSEVQYSVDGMTVNDPTYGGQAMDVSKSSVQEVQVQTGTFNAEYGGALSAIVSIITKEGDPNKVSGSLGYSTTNFRIDALNKFTTNADKLEFSLSGPEPVSTYLLPVFGFKMPRDKRISYFFSITGENSDGTTPYNKVFDLDYENGGAPIATTDDLVSPYNIDYDWYGFFPEKRVNQYQATIKLKQYITPSFRYVLSFNGNWSRWRTFNWYYYYCPEFAYLSTQSSYQAALNITHNVTQKSFYELRFGYFRNDRTYSPGGLTPGDFATDSSAWRTLDDWVDVNNDGIANVRVQWIDINGNGMWDFGEYWEPNISRVDTIWNNPALRDSIIRTDTLFSDTLRPQIGEEPWFDWNANGIFEPRTTNFNSPYSSFFGFNIGEMFMDGEPFLDGYPYGMSYQALINGTGPYPFVMETLWVDINEDGRKDVGEYVYGSYYDTPGNNIVEEYTWYDANDNGTADWGEYEDLNGDGQYTPRDGYCNYYDENGNGRYDVSEYGEPFLDLNGNGKYDGPNYLRDDWEPYIDRNGNTNYDEYSGFQYRGYDRYAVWHERTVDMILVKGDYSNQLDKNNLVKTGIEYQWIRMNMNEIQYPEAKYNGIYDGMPYSDNGIFRSFYTRTPMTFAAYVQDKMEYGGLIANIGLRLDALIQANEVMNDSIQEDLAVFLEPWWETDKVSRTKVKVSPRLGMSYPITDKSKLFFSYGHFYQLPGFDNFYQTPTQGSSAGRLMGNPNLSFEKTVAYELGVAYAFADNWSVQFSGYYKDIYDLLNTSQQRIGPLEQSVYVNSDYARTRGVEFNIDKALSHYWSVNFNYTFAFANGKSSSERSGYDALFDQSAIPLRDLPLNWDQRHLVNLVVDLRASKDEHPEVFGLKMPDRWGINGVLSWGSGYPYTPSKYNPHYEIRPGEKAWERTNILRMPSQFNLDVKLNKDFRIGKFNYSAYLLVGNVTNSRSVLAVSSDTGEPDKSWIVYNADGTYTLIGTDYDKNPANWSTPTDIRLGIEMAW